MHEPFTCQKQRKYEREKRRKPSVKVGVSGGTKIWSWSFTRSVSKLNFHQNAFSVHGKSYFWNKKLTISAPLNCRAASCVPIDLHTCGATDLNRVKISKFYWVSKLKFWHLGFVLLHPKAIFGCLPLNLSIISLILATSRRSKASYLSLSFYQ